MTSKYGTGSTGKNNFLQKNWQAATELRKQESAFKEVKNTQYKLQEKRDEFAALSSEKAELQRKLVR